MTVDNENRMNDIASSELSKYLSLEFINASPETKTLNKKQVVEVEEKEEPKETAFTKLVPREYQYELYQKALHENIIVVLDTGMGKTLISTMLIKQMVLNERQARLTRGKDVKPKLAFFIVDRVPLVFQQASVINSNCSVKLKELCGEMNVDKMSGTVWNNIFDSNDVCVLTAQVLLDCFRRGFLSMDRIHLLIFDECHHTTKKHPFNLIMQEFYFKSPAYQRPKIFGMTASPVSGQKKVDDSIMKLEKNMDSRVYTASNLDELNARMDKPEEILLNYKAPPEYHNTLKTRRLKQELVPYENYERCFINAKQVLLELGPWCCDDMWKAILTSMKRKLEFNSQGFDPANTITAIKRSIQTADSIPIQQNPDIMNTNLFTPKISTLITTLKDLWKKLDTFRGIIFVERRIAAIAIHSLIGSLHDFDSLRTGVLLGHGGGADDYIKMNYKHQNRVVDDFRRGEIDLLIATNVAEEGLDIQPCNVVIRFDFVKTVIAHIQSRGRARKKDSRYIIMIEQDNQDQTRLLATFLNSEKRMKTFCKMLPSERNVANNFSSGNNGLDETNVISIPETGAKLTEQNAISLIYQYCNSLPSDKYCDLKPIFKNIETKEGHKCALILPSNSVVRQVESPYAVSETKAKTAAAFQACALLLEKKGLDEHLRPRNWKSRADRADDYAKNQKGQVLGSRRRLVSYKKKVPELWKKEDAKFDSGSTCCWVSVIEMALSESLTKEGPYRKLCLITKKPLPSLPIFRLFYDIEPFHIGLRNLEIKVKLDNEKITLLSQYMLKLMKGLLNKDYDCGIAGVPYYVAPFVKNCTSKQLENISDASFDTLIDWKEIAHITKATYKKLSLDNDDFCDSIYHPPNTTHSIIESVQYHSNSNSFPPDNVKITEDAILRLKHIPGDINFLHQNVPKKSRAVLLSSAMSFQLKRFYISASVYRSSLLIPSIMSRVDALLLARELQHKYDLNIKDTKIVEACTTTSANLDINYERLEILGDSVLKIVASTCLFLKNPLSNEDELTNLRSQVISNKALLVLANQCELSKYITSQAFNHRNWRPPGLICSMDTAETRQDLECHTLSDKTMADVVEALLGAAYLESGLAGGLDTALQLGMPLGNINPAEYFKLTQKQLNALPETLAEELSSVDISSLQGIMGISFEKPLLIVEALTHASYPTTTVSCYQRLEFLGDAILDILVTGHLYKKYPLADPGTISEMKRACVNNNILGIICLETGLYKHIRHCSDQLIFAIKDLQDSLEDIKRKDKATGEYWSDLNVPKVLADVVESLLGAAFVEANFQLKSCEGLFEKWFLPIINKHVRPELIKADPSSMLMHTLQDFGCRSFVMRNFGTEEFGPEGQSCVVFLHGKPLASGSDWNVKNARRKAATNATKRLSTYPDLLLTVCDCI